MRVLARKLTPVLLAALGAASMLGTQAAEARPLPAQAWGVEVDRATVKQLGPSLRARLSDHPVNALVVSKGALSGAQLRHARRAARAWGHAFVVAMPAGSRRGPKARCRAWERKHRRDECAVLVRSPRAAVRLARKRLAVAVRVKDPGRLGYFRRLGNRGRVFVLVPVGRNPEAVASRWKSAIALARAERALDLVVRGANRRAAFDYYLSLLLADTDPPSMPTGFTETGDTTTTISLVWQAAKDDRGVAEYRLYRDGAYAGTTTDTSYVVAGLACGRVYDLAIEARDAAGNESPRATMRDETTDKCPVSADTVAPTAPSSLAASGSTPKSVSVTWSAAGDNVAVTSYRVYRDGSLAGSTSSTSFTASGLTCETSYTIGVEARDAAGNTSPRVTVGTSTSACPPPDTTAPTAPTSLVKTVGTRTSVSLSWRASSDDVGVAEYRVYRDGVSAGATSSTSSTVSGLACGTTYAFAVEAADEAGNVSPRATLTAATSDCAAPGGDVLFVDRASRGGPCSDARSAEEASSPATPWCSLGRAVAAAPSDTEVAVRAGTYPELNVSNDRDRSSLVTFKPYGSEAVTLQGIDVENVNLLRFEGFRITNYVELGDSSDAIEIVGNDLSPKGIRLRAVDGILIENNLIHDLDPAADGKCGCGVWAQSWGDHGVRNVTVRGNTITDIAGDGVHFGNGRNILIENNTITNALNSGDGDHVDTIQIMRAEPLVIRGNRLQNNQHGIMFTNLASPGVVIENNVVAQIRSYGINAGDIPYARIVNNTFWDNRYGAIILRDDARDEPVPVDVTFKNNIVDAQNSGDGAFGDYDYNLVAAGYLHGPHDISGSATFVDPARGDFRLAAGSKGIDAGSSVGAPGRDRFGNTRRDDPGVANTGAGTPNYYDIGAHEH